MSMQFAFDTIINNGAQQKFRQNKLVVFTEKLPNTGLFNTVLDI